MSGHRAGGHWAWGVVPACGTGLVIMILRHAPWSMPSTNLAAVLLGFIGLRLGGSALASGISKRPAAVTITVLATIAATLFFAGMEGVHRWLPCGPLRLHPAAIGNPVLLLAIVELWQRERTGLAILAIATGLALHIAQPDAGQATALAASSIALAMFSDSRHWARSAIVLCAGVSVWWAWLRPDPLLPVALVEDIVPQAFAMHTLLGITAIVALGMLPCTTVWHAHHARQDHFQRVRGQTLAVYFSTNIVVVAVGVFPTPLLGYGASPILGAIMGLGLLAKLGVRTEPPERLAPQP